MAQSCTVVQADPNSLKDAINALAATSEITWITKTKSAGKFLVIADNAAPAGQQSQVIVGDPASLAAALNVIASTKTIDLVINTFSAAHYLVVYR